jgi:hypothetical protein
VPYNGSKFDLDGKYRSVFKKLVKKDLKGDDGKRKFFKIKYTLNILPACT